MDGLNSIEDSDQDILLWSHGEVECGDFLSSLEYFQNGRYAVLKKLGEGGKVIVYKTRDTVLNSREGSIFGVAEA